MLAPEANSYHDFQQGPILKENKTKYFKLEYNGKHLSTPLPNILIKVCRTGQFCKKKRIVFSESPMKLC